MKTIYTLLLLLVAVSLPSCNDWLDVRPDTEQKEEDQFSNEKSFESAVIGMYMDMADRDIYGERLTMTNIESLANLWYMDSDHNRYEDYYLMQHDYSNVEYSQAAIEAIYAKLFNVIVQANIIIKNAVEHGDVIADPAMRSVIEGEAYAVRAYCQFDALRLFGQVPGGTEQVSLPYSETTTIYEVPPYYDFNAYVEKLKSDIEKAKSLLLDNDPVCHYSFSSLNNSYDDGVDNFMIYRQSRMNYWAVRALEARMYLYIGDKTTAYQIVKEIINATLDGNPVMTMSGVSDFAAGYKLCPSECLFYLSKYDVMDYSSEFLVGGQESFSTWGDLGITHDMYLTLYAGQNSDSHNRMLNCWNTKAQDNYGDMMTVTTKYYWDAENVTNAMLYYQLIPMLRMSEIYLIAMECTTDLNEANSLYRTYMLAHDVSNAADFQSLDEVETFILNEYRREFFVEGQMFYTYKRLNCTEMLWRDEPVSEDEYILPLPTTEYNPNN